MADEGRRTVGAGVRTAGKWAAVAGAAAGAALVPAGAAQANIVGVGNGTFGNTCANLGAGAQAQGATFADSGTVSGNHAALPLSLPRNNCGNSGIVCTALFGSSV